MPDLNKIARDAILLGVTGTVRKSNSAAKRTGLQKQYFRDETLLYTEDVGALASNVYETASQGINFNDWYSYVPIKIRVDNAVFGRVQTSGNELLPQQHFPESASGSVSGNRVPDSSPRLFRSLRR